MKTFLRIHASELATPILPPIPSQPNSLRWLLENCPELMSKGLFQMYAEYTLAVLNPTEVLRAVNQRVVEGRELRASNEGKHWLALWDINKRPEALTVRQILRECWTPSIEESISLADVQDHFLQVADALLANGDDVRGVVVSWANTLGQCRTSSLSLDQSRWNEACRPIVEGIIQRIGKLRTLQWQRNPNRKPAALPDIWPLRLLLLPYLVKSVGPSALAQLSEAIRKLVEELARSPRTYHERFERLRQAALKTSDLDYAALPVHTGQLATELLEQKASRADLLRIDLADSLLRKAKKPRDDKMIEDVKAMVQQWHSSVDEDVRRTAFQLRWVVTSSEYPPLHWLKDAVKAGDWRVI
jgi:hypothetical protein